MPGLLAREDHSEYSSDSSGSYDGPFNKASISAARVPEFIDVVTEPYDPEPAPSVLNALHKFQEDICAHNVSAAEYYTKLSVASVKLSPDMPPCAHVDGGALATTTNRLDYLWAYHKFTELEQRKIPRLKVADDTLHTPTGEGYLKVPCDTSPGFRFIKSYFTPQIPATIMSPNAFGQSLDCKGYHTYSDFVNNIAHLRLVGCSNNSSTISFALHRIRGLLFTDHLLAPTVSERKAPLPSVAGLPEDTASTLPIRILDSHCACKSAEVRTLTAEQTRALWHMRLGHVHHRRLADLHKHVDGIPKIARDDVLHKCPLCLKAKLHKAARGPLATIPEESECWQHIHIDFGFFVQKSQGRAPKKVSASTTRRRARDESVSSIDETLLVSPLRRSARLRANESQINGSTPTPPHPDSPLANTSARPSLESSPPSLSSTNEYYTFERILDHKGPLHPKHRSYLGSRYNLRVRWSDGSTTWESRDLLAADAPEAVAEYAASHKLLERQDWKTFAAHLPDDQTDTFPSDFGHATEMPLTTDQDDDHTIFLGGPDADVQEAKALAAVRRYSRLVGLNGETCYVLITCLKTGSWKISIRKNKTAPLDFFQEFLATHGSTASPRTVRFDLGGELGGNTEVHDLFAQAGYLVETTAPNSSSAIGQVERPHRTIADAVRTMLYSAGLPAKFWPYALRHFVLISNCIPRGDRPDPPITMCTGKRVDLSLLRVFGCRCYALPSHIRDAKVDVHARDGIFLGFKNTFRNALYYDNQTHTVKTARHIAFDEGFNDSKNPPPYVQALRGEIPSDTLHLDNVSSSMAVSLSPFNTVDAVTVKFRPKAKDPLVFSVQPCPRFRRAYVNEFITNFGPHSIDASTRKYLGGYILKIGERFTFSPADVVSAIDHYSALPEPPSALVIHIARDQRTHLSHSQSPSLHLRPVDIRRVTAMNLVAGEGHKNSQAHRHAIRGLASTPPLPCTPPEPEELQVPPAPTLLEMRKLQNDHMTEEERQLKSFTRKNLMKLSNWPEWQAADDKQLDSHYTAGAIGKAVPRPVSDDPNTPSQVFRIVWARIVKATGVRKSRACLDGSKRAAPWLRALVQTYASCIELPCLRAFLAICATRGYYVAFGDVENAYQQSPPPTVDCFLEVDDTVADWYLRKFGVKLNRLKEVIPLYKALQGHPEAGALWERMITDILVNKLGFRHTTHERNLYFGSIDGKEVLACRQVDDFASGAKDKPIAEKFITLVQKYVKAEFEGMGIETGEGLYQRFNGIDIFQTRNYIKVGCESYIDRMLQTHGWESPKHKDPPNLVPIQPSITDRLMTLVGPTEHSPEAKALAHRFGFSYRNLLGELVYAYVICRLDIGYAVCFLSRFSATPHEEHYSALKNVCRYLRAHKSWGILYQRPSPLEDLPDVDFEYLEDDPNLPSFPTALRDELLATLDAAHGTDRATRRSVTGLVVFYCLAAIAWKSRLQTLVATSSTEAEFYAAVVCAKIVKYLRYVFFELDALRPGPTTMFIDNQAALNMINERRPTPRARHIEIQHYAIQEWRAQNDIVMRHLPGVMNNSDDLTKPLGCVLHSRHARRSMGHYKVDPPD